MVSVIRRTFAALLAAATVSACASGGTNGFAPSTQFASATRKHTNAYAKIVIPRRHHRRERFISPATRGVKIVATYLGARGIVSTTIDSLGAGSSHCTVSTTAITCIVTATVWEGRNRIDVTTYDKPPSSGTIPASAHILGEGKTTITVIAGKTPYISVFLGGLIAKIDGSPLFSTLAADGLTHVALLAVNPVDFGNQPIKAGKNDPYANPIAVVLTESGGSGHAQLVLNGTPAGARAKLKYSSDSLSVQYDGLGTLGYTVSVKLSATGVSPQSLEVSPMFVSGPGLSAHALALNGAASNPTLTIAETGAPSTQTYSVTPKGCTSIAAPSTVTGGGASATFAVAGGTLASASGCTLSIADSLSTVYTLPVTNTPTGGTITIGGVTLTEYALGAAIGAPGPMAVGPDNNIWVIGNYSFDAVLGVLHGNEIAPIKPTSGAPSIGTPIAVTGGQLADLTAGSDGAIWAVDYAPSGVDRITPGGVISQYTGPGLAIDSTCGAAGIMTASNGSLWAPACNYLLNVSMDGNFREVKFPTTLLDFHNLVQGSDGNIWATYGANLAYYSGSGLVVNFIPEANGATVNFVASVPSDTACPIWFTSTLASTGTSYIGCAVAGAAATTTLATFGGTTLAQLTSGTDGYVWFADNTKSKIGRIAIAGHAVTEYPTPTGAAGPTSIVLGPDGTLWIAEESLNNILHVLP